jgi:hypothetical protein
VFALVASPAAGKKGDLIVGDYTGGVVRVDPKTGDVSGVAGGPPLDSPSYVTFEPGGDLFVTDEGASDVFRVDPRTGSVNPFVVDEVAQPYGIARAPDSSLVVASYDEDDPFRVDAATRDVSPLTSDAFLGDAYGVVATPEGTLFATDNGGRVLRVSPDVRELGARGLRVGRPVGNRSVAEGRLVCWRRLRRQDRSPEPEVGRDRSGCSRWHRLPVWPRGWFRRHDLFDGLCQRRGCA